MIVALSASICHYRPILPHFLSRLHFLGQQKAYLPVYVGLGRGHMILYGGRSACCASLSMRKSMQQSAMDF